MGGDQASKVILQIQEAALEAKGQTHTEQEKAKILKGIKDKYEETTTAYYAASRIWVDAVIDPLDTRKWISMGIEAANHTPIEKFNVGVLQT
jgi:3-methylcrotonyl-CoA carboxylase beta subunit